MQRKIYPIRSRSNASIRLYTEIAVESCYHMDKFYMAIENNNYSLECKTEYSSLVKSAMNTIVFSAMALEAFFNDYGAACIGDSVFDKDYGQCSPTGKMLIISGLVFGEKMDTSKECYCKVKELFKIRNSLVHWKSEPLRFHNLSDEELREKILQEDKDLLQEPTTLDRKNVRKIYRDGIDALKAVKLVAQYFDDHDLHAVALLRFFDPFEVYMNTSEECKHKAEVLKLIGIEAQKI